MHIKTAAENRCCLFSALLVAEDLGNNAGAYGPAAFADSETEAFFAGDGGDQGDLHVDVVAGHNHLNALGQLDVAGNVGGAEVELRTIAVKNGV